MAKAKSTKPKSKKFFYRRASWSGQGKQTLEQLLVAAHDDLTTVADRTFTTAAGNEIQGARILPDPKGLFLHIASYTPGEPTSTIGKTKTGKSATISAEDPPAGKDYLDGDAFVMVKDNHVLLCLSNARESLINQYFYLILQRYEHAAAGSLSIESVANGSKVRMLRQEGVKEIRLGASLYEASLMDIEEKHNKVSSIKAVIANQIQRIFAEDPNLKTIKESENLNIDISIKFDGKEGRKKHKDPEFGEAGKVRLLKASQQILNESKTEDGDDGFVIITGNGNTITSGDVRVFETYKVAGLGKSLDHQDAWFQLLNYYDRLSENGALKQ